MENTVDIRTIQKEQILQLITEDVPQAFWGELQSPARALYSGVFQEVKEDPNYLESQKPNMLWQKRHFRMEALVLQVAKNTGVPASEEAIVNNRCAYAYLCPGRVAMTQSYVPDGGKLPRPSAFRRTHAAMNMFSREPQLDLGDKIVEVSAPKRVNGLLIHSPAGHKFDREAQKLGALGFYVPNYDYSDWVVNLSLTEILTAYKPVTKREDKAVPRWKSGKAGPDRKTK